MATTDEIEAVLSKSFDGLNTSFPDMKDKQVNAVIGALNVNDVFISLPTGYGKKQYLPYFRKLLTFYALTVRNFPSSLKQICHIFEQRSDTDSSEVSALYSRAKVETDLAIATSSLYAGDLFACHGRRVRPIPRDSGNRKKKLRLTLFRNINTGDHKDFATWLSRTTNFPIKFPS